MTYDRLARLTQGYRRSAGLDSREVAPDLKAAGEALVQAKNDLELLEEEYKKFMDGIIPGGEIPEETAAEKTRLEAAVAQAQNQVAFTQTRYDTELAKWRSQSQT